MNQVAARAAARKLYYDWAPFPDHVGANRVGADQWLDQVCMVQGQSKGPVRLYYDFSQTSSDNLKLYFVGNVVSTMVGVALGVGGVGAGPTLLSLTIQTSDFPLAIS